MIIKIIADLRGGVASLVVAGEADAPAAAL